jgi:hypothetical protein
MIGNFTRWRRSGSVMPRGKAEAAPLRRSVSMGCAIDVFILKTSPIFSVLSIQHRFNEAAWVRIKRGELTTESGIKKEFTEFLR